MEKELLHFHVTDFNIFSEFICHRDRKDTKSCILPSLHYAKRNFHYLYTSRTDYCLSLQMDKLEKCLTKLYQLEDCYKDFIYKFICLAMLFHLPLSSNNQTCCKNIILPCLPIRPQVLLKTPTYMLSNSFLIHIQKYHQIYREMP